MLADVVTHRHGGRPQGSPNPFVARRDTLAVDNNGRSCRHGWPPPLRPKRRHRGLLPNPGNVENEEQQTCSMSFCAQCVYFFPPDATTALQFAMGVPCLSWAPATLFSIS